MIKSGLHCILVNGIKIRHSFIQGVPDFTTWPSHVSTPLYERLIHSFVLVIWLSLILQKHMYMPLPPSVPEAVAVPGVTLVVATTAQTFVNTSVIPISNSQHQIWSNRRHCTLNAWCIKMAICQLFVACWCKRSVYIHWSHQIEPNLIIIDIISSELVAKCVSSLWLQPIRTGLLYSGLSLQCHKGRHRIHCRLFRGLHYLLHSDWS